jgi:HK97 gp10 family phage protein
MARGQSIQVEGLEQVVRELRRRGADVQAALEQICHAGAEPILDDAQARAPQSIANTLEKQTTTKRQNKVVVTIGPIKAKHIARFTEFGTAPHRIVARKAAGRKRGRKALAVPGFGVFRSVQHPGAQKRPFMRPAYHANKGNAQDEMRSGIKRALRA